MRERLGSLTISLHPEELLEALLQIGIDAQIAGIGIGDLSPEVEMQVANEVQEVGFAEWRFVAERFHTASHGAGIAVVVRMAPLCTGFHTASRNSAKCCGEGLGLTDRPGGPCRDGGRDVLEMRKDLSDPGGPFGAGPAVASSPMMFFSRVNVNAPVALENFTW